MVVSSGATCLPAGRFACIWRMFWGWPKEAKAELRGHLKALDFFVAFLIKQKSKEKKVLKNK
ncbi:MAG: hypothetical protein FD145_752 [Candidatus Saganbacteria bacterium]|uniref:Uncharacterized protein n=1 Tax=Candidatus Saganbacteria bacterium TaxID=2575572 RepID=A0A833L194_UNCSA|nr:MAG: hypothetical protein FD145_752 [Candidatus Saganbacteria bacterium]